MIALLAFIGFVWLVNDPYAGLVHDAKLYALQALADLQPATLGRDLFLKYGSQDRFTVFPRIYAPLAAAVGLEPAAAVLTLVLAILWLVLGYLLARSVSDSRLALLSLGFLVSIPGWYGSYQVIHVGEMYLSARLPAEVGGLLALLAHLRGNRLVAFGLAALATAVHPLMGIAVVGMLMLLEVHARFGIEGVRYASLLAVAAGVGFAMAYPILPVDDDTQWRAVVHSRSGWLFPSLWRLSDWQYHVLLFATLAVVPRVCGDRRLAGIANCALWLGLVGLALAVLGGAFSTQPLLLRAQTWRWVWVTCVIAIIALPLALDGLWKREVRTADRAAAVLLFAGWVTATEIGGLLALAALALTCLPEDRTAPLARNLMFGACSIMGVICVAKLIPAIQYAVRPFDTNADPLTVQRLVNFAGAESIGLILVASAWGLAQLRSARTLGRLGRLGLFAAAVVLLVSIGPRTVRDWTSPNYPQAAVDAFSGWRRIIPPTAEVLWPSDAMAAWVFLERRNYLSQDQLAGILYSPGMTPEFMRRAEALRALADPDWWTLENLAPSAQPKPLTPELLRQVCTAPGLDFVVYEADLGGAVASARLPTRELTVYLHDCRALVATRGANG